MTQKHGVFFDDNFERVPAVDFVFPGDAAADERETDAMELLRHGLLIVLGENTHRHRDAARTRAAALAVLCDLFNSPTHAAKALGMNRSSLHRAVTAMRRELLQHQNPTKEPMNKG